MRAPTYIKGKRIRRRWYVAVSDGTAWAVGAAGSLPEALAEATWQLAHSPIVPTRLALPQ